MARRNPIPFIPTVANTPKVSQSTAQIGALLGSVAQVAQLGIQTQLNAQGEELEKATAMAKVHQLGLDETAKALSREKAEEFTGLQRQQQAAASSQRSFDKASAQIVKTEKQGIFATINGLSTEQLKTANAKGLGFTSTEAVLLADQAIGERQANLDFPKLLERIAGDESKLPSEHLQKFLQGQNLQNESAGLVYADVLSNRLDRFNTSAILERAKKSRVLAHQNAIDGFAFNIATGFDTLDAETFRNDLAALHRGLKSANPNISDTEFKAFATQAMAPLFVGRQARFSAAEGLLKLKELFTESEAEKFGLGGLVVQLEKAATKEFADGIGNQISTASTANQLEQALLGVQRLESSGVVAPSMIQEFKTNGTKQLQKIQASIEVNEVIERGGRGVAPITVEHDDAIDSATDGKGFIGSEAAQFQVKTFGRITDRTIKQMDALASSIDGREVGEAINMWNAIFNENPVYAYEIATNQDLKGSLPEKLAALALDVKARGVAGLKDLEAIPTSIFDSVADIYDEPNKGKSERSGDKILPKVSDQFKETGNRIPFYGQPAQTVANATQQRAFRSIAISRMALMRSNGETDTDTLYEAGTSHAKKQIAKLYQRVTIAGETYAVPTARAGIFNSTARTKDNADKLFREHLIELNSLSTVGDYRFDFDNAEIVDRELVVPVKRDGQKLHEDDWFRMPVMPSVIEEAANPTLHPFDDVGNAFNRHSQFPAIGRLLYGDPDKKDNN